MTFINDLEDECYFDGTAITKSTYKWNTYGHKVFYDNVLDWEMPNQECIYETIYNDNDSVTRAYDINGNVIYETFDNGEGAYSVYPKGTAIVRYENINGVLKEKIEYTNEPIINYFDEYGDLYCIKRNNGSCSYLFNTQ